MRIVRKEDRERFIDQLVDLVEQNVAEATKTARYSEEQFSDLVGFTLEKVAEALFESVKEKI